MSAWSELITRALPGPVSGMPAEPLTVRAGEVLTRVDGHEVSLIRRVLSEGEWGRVCAALASQEVFRARVLAGELPPETARVFEVLGADLVPPGWDAVVATCSCPEWRGRCAHVVAARSEVASEADRDPFALARWAGLDRKALIARVVGAARIPEEDETPGEETAGEQSPESTENAPSGSAAAFWRSLPPPDPPLLPERFGERVRAAAPGSLADELPEIDRFGT